MSQRTQDSRLFEPRSERLSDTVIRAVADAEGVEPSALDTPLYEVIDPDALDRLFRSPADGSHSTGCITFEYYGYGVNVRADGQLTLTER